MTTVCLVTDSLVTTRTQAKIAKASKTGYQIGFDCGCTDLSSDVQEEWQTSRICWSPQQSVISVNRDL